MSGGRISTSPPPCLPCLPRHSLRREFLLSLFPHGIATSSSPCFTPSLSLFPRGRHRRDRKPAPAPDRGLDLFYPIDDLRGRGSVSVERFFRSSEARIRRILSSGADAYRDLSSSVRVERGHRIVFSCRTSSLLFLANLVLWSFSAVLAARVVAWTRRRWRWWDFGELAVVRRDRSLGGREVVIGKKSEGREAEKRGSRLSMNPLSPTRGMVMESSIDSLSIMRSMKQQKLPQWWPETAPSPEVITGREGQRDADRLVQEIMDKRMSGMDYNDDDIIQIRQICRTSGAKVSFGTDNSRDSFYRASVEFVLDMCSRSRQQEAVPEVAGEDVRQFISGLASNIGLENFRAARFVRAAVAARTRSAVLQSWAFEVQGKRTEALEELSKICHVHWLFPFEEYSPEMEMVAGGLSMILSKEKRMHLRHLFMEACCSSSQRITREALGLVYLTKLFTL